MPATVITKDLNTRDSSRLIVYPSESSPFASEYSSMTVYVNITMLPRMVHLVASALTV